MQGAIRAANITATNIATKTLTASGDVTVENGGTLLLTGRDLSASGGANDSSSIAGTLVVNNTNADKSNPGTLGDITVQGNTSITGSNLAGNAVVLNGAANSIVASSSLAADSLEVNGALRADQSSASVTGDFSAKALAANNSTIIADSDHDGSGDAVIAAPITEFAESALQGANVYLVGEGSDTTAASGITGSITATSGDIVAGPDTGSTPVYKDILQGDGKLSLSAVNGSIKAANIIATSIRAKQLTAHGDVALTGDGALVLTGTASQGTGSTVAGDLALTDTASQVADLTVTGKTTIDGGSLKSFANNGNVDTLTLRGGGVIKNGAAVNVEKLVLGDGQTLAVGSQKDAKGGTSLRAGTLSLNDGVLTAEGVWGNSPTVVAADFASDGKGNRIVDGDVAVGRNAKVTLGSSDPTWLNNKINGALNGGALSPTGTSAVLGIANPVKLGSTASGTAGIMVDGSQTGADAAQGIVDNHVVIRDNSLLVVNAAAADTLTSADGALSSATPGATATVADRANIRITDAKALRTYTVFGTNFDNVKNNVNATTDTPLLSLTRTSDGKSYTSNVVSPETVYPDISGEMGDIIRKGLLLDQIGPSHVNDSSGGRRFLSRTIDSRYIGDDKRTAVRTMESARDMVGVAGVDEMLWAAHNAAGAAVTQRTSLVAPSGNMQTMQADGTVATGVSSGDPTGMGGNYDNSGFAMWVMPLYQSYNAWGIEGSGGNLDRDFNGRLGGVALGADYTFDNALRAGVNFNIGAGHGEGKGDYSKTTNNMNFWGLGAYAGVTRENFGLAADVNFTSTYNKLKQELPGGMHMSDLKADVTARAISAGLRGEYKIATGVADIVPHGGVRYTNLHIDGYDAKSNGTVVKGEAINQNIWTFPMGVALRRRMDLENGWWLKPGVDVGVTPAAGQIKGNADIRFSGVSGRAETVVQPLDYITYYGQAGLEVGNDDLALGVNYNLQVGQHHTNHSLFGTFRVDF